MGVDHALRHEFEALFIEEAWLLDSGQFEAWLELFDAETRYWAPVRANVGRGEENFDTPHLLTHFDESKATLELRIKRLRTGNAHAEEPPSRTRHFVSNVRILEGPADDRVHVASNFMVFRSRPGREEYLFVGQRLDRWRRDGDSWKNLERQIVFDHDVIENITLLY